MTTPLLAPGALKGLRIGLSASESADLDRLGLLDEHFRLALRELARIVLVSGGTIVYGGNLDDSSYTWVLVNELRRYGGNDTGLVVVLHWLEHRRRSVEKLEQFQNESLGLQGELICLPEDGSQPLKDFRTGRQDEPGPAVTDRDANFASVTGMRRFMTSRCNARLLIGGKRHGYIGPMPGVMQEALLSMQAGQALYLASGFGGITLDLTTAVDAECGNLLPPYPTDQALEPAALMGLDEMKATTQHAGWAALNNRLTEAENRQLATTHRPAEIAALVGLGLGRGRLPQT